MVMVYPRVCGGTRSTTPACRASRGLSPRVRGNPVPGGTCAGSGGSIPACAGEPHGGVSSPSPSRVYPRVCGGTLVQHHILDEDVGLSPRVRGNPPRRATTCFVVGSIPACAGEPFGGALGCHYTGVYPRVCGGTPVRCAAPGQAVGLSPRVRGNRGGIRPVPGRQRSIPACAGEPRACVLIERQPEVYPRVCGGTSLPSLPRQAREGLSPRVRGNLPVRLAGIADSWSIPACAGEPFVDIPLAVIYQVYPRVCGGTACANASPCRPEGLSPRVRGNHGTGARRSGGARSIPACAGEPAGRIIRRPGKRVYPRVCGGTPVTAGRQANAAGLSPRVRGNPARAGPPAGPAQTATVYPRVCGGTRTAAGCNHHRLGLSPRVRGNPAGAGLALNRQRSIPACAGEPRS